MTTFLAPDRVVYAGTVSKTLAPGIRLGWLVPPMDLIPTFRRIQKRRNEGPGRIEQTALAHLIEAGDYDSHIRRMRRMYRERRDLVCSLLAEHCPQVRVTGVAAGLHVTVQLPEGVSEDKVCQAMAQHGVAVHGIAPHRIRTSPDAVLLIGYGRATETSIRAGIQVLARILAWA